LNLFLILPMDVSDRAWARACLSLDGWLFFLENKTFLLLLMFFYEIIHRPKSFIFSILFYVHLLINYIFLNFIHSKKEGENHHAQG